MNRFFARHWEKRYKYLTQCSENPPFVRKIGGGGHVSFTDPLKLIRYLETSEEAMYLWTHSEDFAIISDMYQVKIKITGRKSRAFQGLGEQRGIISIWFNPL